MTKVRYLLDENMPYAVRDQLLYHEQTLQALCIHGGENVNMQDPAPWITWPLGFKKTFQKVETVGVGSDLETVFFTSVL